MHPATQHRFVDMRIADVLKAPAPPGCYIVLLGERGGQRQLRIWIAGAEATPMALRLSGMGTPARPLGSDLAAALVAALGGRLAEVRVDRLDQGTFYYCWASWTGVRISGPPKPSRVPPGPAATHSAT